MYLEYYGLGTKPFQLNPDLRFFFESSGHKRALSYLRYGLIEGQGFIVVTGRVGTGKTTLARSLLRELDTGAVVAGHLVSTQLDADDLLQATVAAFGLSHEGLSKASLLTQFEQFIKGLAARGSRALLLVDEAQSLSARSLEELRMLSNIQISDSLPLQSFLLGQEEFRATIASPAMEQLRQRVIAICHLSPFSAAETRDYIEHRLGVAGWSGRPEISNGAYLEIQRATNGVPRKINVLCDRVLLYGCLEELNVISAETAARVVREMTGEDVPSPEPVTQTPDPAVEDSPKLSSLEQRIAELERRLAVLAESEKSALPQTESETLTGQVTDVKTELAGLQRGIWELTKLVSSKIASK